MFKASLDYMKPCLKKRKQKPKPKKKSRCWGLGGERGRKGGREGKGRRREEGRKLLLL